MLSKEQLDRQEFDIPVIQRSIDSPTTQRPDWVKTGADFVKWMCIRKEELDRQDFEAWFVPTYHPRHMNRNNSGDYLFIDAEIAWTAWKARSAELLSLREQLAELKALEPIGQIVLSDYDPDGTRTARVVCLHDQADWDNFQDGTLLFTAAKPEALPRHIYSMLVNELRDVPAIGCKRELIVGVLNRHGVIAEPVGD